MTTPYIEAREKIVAIAGSKIYPQVEIILGDMEAALLFEPTIDADDIALAKKKLLESFWDENPDGTEEQAVHQGLITAEKMDEVVLAILKRKRDQQAKLRLDLERKFTVFLTHLAQYLNDTTNESYRSDLAAWQWNPLFRAPLLEIISIVESNNNKKMHAALGITPKNNKKEDAPLRSEESKQSSQNVSRRASVSKENVSASVPKSAPLQNSFSIAETQINRCLLQLQTIIVQIKSNHLRNLGEIYFGNLKKLLSGIQNKVNINLLFEQMITSESEFFHAIDGWSGYEDKMDGQIDHQHFASKSEQQDYDKVSKIEKEDESDRAENQITLKQQQIAVLKELVSLRILVLPILGKDKSKFFTDQGWSALFAQEQRANAADELWKLTFAQLKTLDENIKESEILAGIDKEIKAEPVKVDKKPAELKVEVLNISSKSSRLAIEDTVETSTNNDSKVSFELDKSVKEKFERLRGDVVLRVTQARLENLRLNIFRCSTIARTKQTLSELSIKIKEAEISRAALGATNPFSYGWLVISSWFSDASVKRLRMIDVTDKNLAAHKVAEEKYEKKLRAKSIHPERLALIVDNIKQSGLSNYTAATAIAEHLRYLGNDIFIELMEENPIIAIVMVNEYVKTITTPILKAIVNQIGKRNDIVSQLTPDALIDFYLKIFEHAPDLFSSTALGMNIPENHRTEKNIATRLALLFLNDSQQLQAAILKNPKLLKQACATPNLELLEKLCKHKEFREKVLANAQLQKILLDVRSLNVGTDVTNFSSLVSLVLWQQSKADGEVYTAKMNEFCSKHPVLSDGMYKCVYSQRVVKEFVKDAKVEQQESKEEEYVLDAELAMGEALAKWEGRPRLLEDLNAIRERSLSRGNSPTPESSPKIRAVEPNSKLDSLQLPEEADVRTVVACR